MLLRNSSLRCSLKVKVKVRVNFNAATLSLATSLRHLSSTIPLSNQNSSSPSNKNTKTEDLPWFMRPEESPSISSPLKQTQIPELPASSPQSLQPILEYIATKLGITDLDVFDLRYNESGLINEGAEDVANFMIIGTGKSSRHLQKAAHELSYFIKHTLNKIPETEGLLTTGQLAKFQRRLLKKGKKAPNYSRNDYGSAPNTWVMMDCKTDDIYVHFLTAERRIDLNLEDLWATDKSKYQKQVKAEENDDIFSGVRYYHTSTGRPRPSIVQQLQQIQKMTLSTSADEFDPTILTRENYGSRFEVLKKLHLSDPEHFSFSLIDNHFKSMQVNGLQLTTDDLIDLISLSIQSSEFHDGITTASEAFEKRINFITELLELYKPSISKKDISRLIPVCVAAGSQIDNTKFITLDKLSATSVSQVEEGSVFEYHDSVKTLHDLSYYLTYKRLDHEHSQRNLDLLLLMVYTNASKFNNVRKVLEAALDRQDFEVLSAAITLLGVRGDAQVCYKFLNDYLPLLQISNRFKLAEYKTGVKLMLDKCDPSHFSELRDQLKSE